MLGEITAEGARAFLDSTRFIWHQRFELAPGIMTPGTSSVSFLLEQAGIPADLSGRSVIDVGTSNGGCAFEVERRGASRVVAVDIYPPEWFGFSDLHRLCNSRVEFVQTTVYELPERLKEQFDLVLFFGVLYHLRHPLLALDRLRELARQDVVIETAVCDHEHPFVSQGDYVRFYRGKELGADSSNWFAPSVKALVSWMSSSGYLVTQASGWPEHAPQRAMVRARRLPDPAEYRTLSYERPIISVRTEGS
jgi:tRNA (mo5U34)-methyltransferase